ncbi:MAG: ATP-binding protein, partial [Propionibacteriaceae bacterium]|nr:ATP-binding protein [Propionibacteriaceae bacterium]
AVTNVVRHADAGTCTVTVDDGVLTVTDDGRGIAGGTGSGSGLEGLRRRVEQAGGSLAVTSGAGTTVTAHLPPRVPSVPEERGNVSRGQP